MSNKIFIFGIGGTGARVIKSLVMLLAAGVECKKELVPILIDPDNTNADLGRTAEVLKQYQFISKQVRNYEHNNFFKTNILTAGEVIKNQGKDGMIIDRFQYELKGVKNDTFRRFIDHGNLDANNKHFADLLFSEDDLDLQLEVGFKGNPNIGSVVLNQIANSELMVSFANNFQEGDRIFIISSIFGGTGAAGFPLLLKNIRQGEVKGENKAFLQNAPIGAVTVMPYFKVAPDEKSKIESHGFITKTKAALNYYASNVSGNKSVNDLYYIGDDTTKEYGNFEGGKEQQNYAHFVEIASALAIINFSNIHDSSLETENGKAKDPIYNIYGLKHEASTINFKNLGPATQKWIRNQLTEYFYFNLFLKKSLADELSNPFAGNINDKERIDKNFLSGNFYETLSKFNDSFRIWLGELKENRVSFEPIKFSVIEVENNVEDIDLQTKSIFSIISEHPEKKGLMGNLPFSSKNYELFIEKLNEAAEKIGPGKLNEKFMGMFSKASRELVKEKIFIE